MSNPPAVATNGKKLHHTNPAETPSRIPSHGKGRLRTGGTNKGGPGRMPEALRMRSRGVFEQWLAWAETKINDPDIDDALMLQIGNTAAKYGLGTTITPTNTAGDDLPPLVYTIGGANASAS